MPQGTDFFLPHMVADMSAFTDRVATSSELVGMLSSTLLLVRTPCWTSGGSEVIGSAGNLPAPSASQDAVKKISFQNRRFLDERLSFALTGHSERNTMQSLLAGLGVPQRGATVSGQVVCLRI